MAKIKEEFASKCRSDTEPAQFAFSSNIKKDEDADPIAHPMVKQENQRNIDEIKLEPGSEDTAIEHQNVGDLKRVKCEEDWSPYLSSGELFLREMDSIKVEPESDGDDETVSSNEVHPSELKQGPENILQLSTETESLPHNLQVLDLVPAANYPNSFIIIPSTILFVDGSSDKTNNTSGCITDSENVEHSNEVGQIKKIKLFHDGIFDGQLFICPHCGRNFESEIVLKQHTQIHSGEFYICDVCKEKYPDMWTLLNHSRCHSMSSGDYRCIECNITYNFLCDYIKHMCLHTTRCPFTCSVCRKMFLSSTSFTRHKHVHSRQHRYNCDYCSKSYTNFCRFKMHEQEHKEELYECKICQKSFTQYNAYRIHIKNHSRTRKC